MNDIKVEYHPNSGIPTSVEHLHEYRQRRLGERQQLADQPWKPFRTRGDFEFAEIALDAALNERVNQPHPSLYQRPDFLYPQQPCRTMPVVGTDI